MMASHALGCTGTTIKSRQRDELEVLVGKNAHFAKPEKTFEIPKDLPREITVGG